MPNKNKKIQEVRTQPNAETSKDPVRNSYLESMAEKLLELDQFINEVRDSTGSRKEMLNQRLQNLKTKFEELKEGSQVVFDDLKMGFEAAKEDLQKQVEKLKAS